MANDKSLGRVQRSVLGLCAIHEHATVTKIAAELGRSEHQIRQVVLALEDRGLIVEMRPVRESLRFLGVVT